MVCREQSCGWGLSDKSRVSSASIALLPGGKAESVKVQRRFCSDDVPVYEMSAAGGADSG